MASRLTSIAAAPVISERLREQNLAQRRAAYLRQLKTVNLAAPPAPVHRGLFGSITHFGSHELQLAAKQVASSLIHTPPGLYETGKAAALDEIAMFGRGDTTFPHLRHMGVEMVKAIAQDVRHPLANPGNLLLDALLAEQGGSLVFKAGKVAGATRAAAIEGTLPESGRLPSRAIAAPPIPPSMEGPAALKGVPKTKEGAQLLKDMEAQAAQRAAEKKAKGEKAHARFVEEAKQIIEQPHIKGELAPSGKKLRYKDFRKHKELNLQGEGIVLEAGAQGYPQLRGGVRLGLFRRLSGKQHVFQLGVLDQATSPVWQKLSFPPTQAEVDAFVAKGGKPEDMRRFSAPDVIGTDPKTARTVFERTVNEYQSGRDLRDLNIVHTQEPFQMQGTKLVPTGGRAERLGMVEPGAKLLSPTERQAARVEQLRQLAQPAAKELYQAVEPRVFRTAAERTAAIKELIPLINKGHVADVNQAGKALGTTAEGARVVFARAKRALAKAKKQGIANRVAYTRVSEESLARLRAETPSAAAPPPELGDLYRVINQFGQKFRGKEYAPGEEPAARAVRAPEEIALDRAIQNAAEDLRKAHLNRARAEQMGRKPETIAKHKANEARLRQALTELVASRGDVPPPELLAGQELPTSLIEMERARKAARTYKEKAAADEAAAAKKAAADEAAAARAKAEQRAAPAPAKEAPTEPRTVEVKTELPPEKPGTVQVTPEKSPVTGEPVTVRVTTSDGTVYEKTVARVPANWQAWARTNVAGLRVNTEGATFEMFKASPEEAAKVAPVEAAPVAEVTPPEPVAPEDTPVTPEEAAQQAEIDKEWERRLKEAPAESGAARAATAQRDLRRAEDRLDRAREKLAEAQDTGTDTEFREAESELQAATDAVDRASKKVVELTPRETPSPKPATQKPPPTESDVRKEMSTAARAGADLQYLKQQSKKTGFARVDEIAKAQQRLVRAKTDAAIVKEAQATQLSEEQVTAKHLDEITQAVKKEQRAKTSARTMGTNDRALGINKNTLLKYGVPEGAWQQIRNEMRYSFEKGDLNQQAIFEKHLGKKVGRQVYAQWSKDFKEKFQVRGGSVDETGFPSELRPRSEAEASALAMRAFVRYLLGDRPRETMNIAPPEDIRTEAEIKAGVPDVVPERKYTPPVQSAWLGDQEFVQSTTPYYEQTLSLHPTTRFLQEWYFEARRRVAGELPTGPGTAFARRIGMTRRAQKSLYRKRISTYRRVSSLNEATNIAIQAFSIENADARARFLQKVIDDRQKYVGSTEGWQRGMDTLNQLSTMGVLYMKGPAFYVPNFAGQGLIFAMSSKFNAPRMMAGMRLVGDIQKQSPLAAEIMLSSVGQGTLARLVQPEAGTTGRIGGAVRRPYNVLASAYEGGISIKRGGKFVNVSGQGRRILPGVDRQWRAGSIGVELIERGIKTPEDAIDLMTNPTRRGDWLDTVQRADDNAVSFSHMGDAERKYVRRFIFFYPWLKGASRFSVRYLMTHPVGAAVMIGQSRYAAQVQQSTLPPLPSYLEGIFRGPDVNVPFFGNLSKENVPGLGVVPRTFNPASLTVLGTPADILSAAEANLLSGKPTGSEQLGRFLNPTTTLALEAIFRRDLMTGAQFKAGTAVPDIVKQEVAQILYPINLKDQILRARATAAGEKDVTQTLLPRLPTDVAGRFLTGLGPTPLNPQEAASRAFAERSGLADKRQRVYMKSTRDRQTYHDTAVKLGVIKPNERLPANLRQAFNQRAMREANQRAWEMKLGHPLSTLERFQADLSLAVRRKVLPAAAATSILRQVAQLASDSQVEQIYRKFREIVFGPDVIAAYKRYFNQRLEMLGEARLTVP